MIDGQQDAHPKTARTLVLHAAEWSLPGLTGVTAMSYDQAQQDGLHDFVDYDRFVMLPVQYPSIAPRETRWEMQQKLETVLLRGATAMVLVPPPGEMPDPKVADDEPFNSTRQLLRQITGGSSGAFLEEVPGRRRRGLVLSPACPPHLQAHLRASPPHFLTRSSASAQLTLASYGRTFPEPAVLAAAHGEGLWSALPFSAESPSGKDLIALLEELAGLGMKLRDDSDRATARTDAANRFIRKGKVWELCFRGKSLSLPHLDGLRDIANILLAGGRPVDRFDLLDREKPAQTKVDPVWDRTTHSQVESAIEAARTEVARLEASTEPTDLEELEGRRADLAEFERLARDSKGRGGRPRALDPRFKQAQDAVRTRIRTALVKIKAEHPELYEHLNEALRAGRYQAYLPAGGPVGWMIHL